jgi:hypothetical protein
MKYDFMQSKLRGCPPKIELNSNSEKCQNCIRGPNPDCRFDLTIWGNKCPPPPSVFAQYDNTLKETGYLHWGINE